MPPPDYSDTIQEAAKANGLDPSLLTAVIAQESGGRPNVVSSRGAIGPMQLMPATAQDLGVDPHDPVQNIHGGAHYLRQQIDAFGSVPLGLAAYNAGPGAVAKHGGIPPFPETQQYVSKVLSASGADGDAELARVLGGGSAPGGGGGDALMSVLGAGKALAAGGDAFAAALGGAPAPSSPPAPGKPAPVPQIDAFSAALGTGSKPAAAGAPAGDGSVQLGETGQPVNAAQTGAYQAAIHRGQIHVDAQGNVLGEVGSFNAPYMMDASGENPVTKPGAYFYDLGGNLQRVPLTAEGQKAENEALGSEHMSDHGAALFNGLLQGFGPEAVGGARALATGANVLMGGHPGYSIGDAYSAGKNVAREQLGDYAQLHPNLSALQTVGGSLMTGVPLIEAGGAALGAAGVPAMLGPTGEFLAGASGRLATGEAAPGIGSALLRTGSRVANAGVQGGAFSGLASHENPNEPIGNQLLEGAAGGAALSGGLALGKGGAKLLMKVPGVGEAVEAVQQAAEPAAQRAIRAIQEFAQGGPTALDLTEHVPGSTPTLAEATQNPGLMAAQRIAKSTPGGVGNTFLGRETDQNVARRTFLEALRGDNDALRDMIADRSASTSALREGAFADAAPVDPAPVAAKIDSIVASPEGQRDAVRKVLGNIRAKLIDSDGLPQTEPAQLYGIRQALTDLYSTSDAPEARVASSALTQVKDALDDAIETGAPGYKAYLKAFADASGPINEREFLLGRTLTAGKEDYPTLAKVKAGLKAISDAQRRPGVSDAKAASDDTVTRLQALQADLQRSDINPSPAAGSPTYERMSGDQKLNALGIIARVGAMKVPGVGFANQLLEGANNSRNAKATQMFYNMLLNPRLGAQALQPQLRLAPVGSNPLVGAVGGYGVDHLHPLLAPPTPNALLAPAH